MALFRIIMVTQLRARHSTLSLMEWTLGCFSTMQSLVILANLTTLTDTREISQPPAYLETCSNWMYVIVTCASLVSEDPLVSLGGMKKNPTSEIRVLQPLWTSNTATRCITEEPPSPCGLDGDV